MKLSEKANEEARVDMPYAIAKPLYRVKAARNFNIADERTEILQAGYGFGNLCWHRHLPRPLLG